MYPSFVYLAMADKAQVLNSRPYSSLCCPKNGKLKLSLFKYKNAITTLVIILLFLDCWATLLNIAQLTMLSKTCGAIISTIFSPKTTSYGSETTILSNLAFPRGTRKG